MIESVHAALLRRRKADGPPFDDDCRIALVAEGGAMRGVHAGGMVSAIEAAGYLNCFDLLVGSSAGACALAYLRAGQARFGTRMFYEDLNTGVFIQNRRLLCGGPIVSIDFLVDDVFQSLKPLDLHKFQEPGPLLYATASDVDSAEPVLLSGFDDPARALEILRASARMPLISGGPVPLDNRRYLDGGLLAPTPIGQARALGATHILLILTHPPGAAAPLRPSFIDRTVGRRLLARRYGRRLEQGFTAAREDYAKVYQALGNGAEVMMAGVPVQAVRPAAGALLIGRTTQSGAALRAGAANAERAMAEYLKNGTASQSPSIC